MMDTDQIAQAYGISPEEARNLVVTDFNHARFTPPEISAPQPVAYQQPQAKGLFDEMPFHDWLAKNAKQQYGLDPWNLSDEQIQKGLDDYINGPVRAIVGHQLNQTKRFPSDRAREAAINDELQYHRVNALQELQANLQPLKEYLQSLRPSGVEEQAAQLPSGLGQQALNAVTRGVLGLGRGALLVGGGLASYLNQDLGDTLFRKSEELKKAQQNIPQGNPIVEAIGGLPAGILNVPFSGAEAGANVLQKGGSLPEAAIAAGKEAIENAALIGAGGVAGKIANPLIRRALGGAATGVTGEVIRRAENAANPNEQQPFDPVQAGVNVALGALGAGKRGTIDKAVTPKDVAVFDQTSVAPNVPKEIDQRLENSFERIVEAKPEQAQEIFTDLAKDVPPEQLPILARAFNDDWEKIHNTRPIPEPAVEQPAPAEQPVATVTEQPAATEQPTAAEQPAAAATEQPAAAAEQPATTPEQALMQVPGFSNKTREVLGKGLGKVEVTFESPIDKALYLISRKDTPLVQKAQLEEALRKLGIREDEITDRAQKLGEYVSKQAKQKGYKFTVSDQSKATRPKVRPPLK